MLRNTTLAAAVLLATATSAAYAGEKHSHSNELTEEQVTTLKQGWGAGIVEIGDVYTKGGDYKEAAKKHIAKFYAYGDRPVLFKPTLASKDQFRGTADEALSYFVGGQIDEDKGFAIAPYTKVRWENEGTNIEGNSAMSMGNYYFTKPDGSEVKVEYTFGVEKMDDGELKIVLHHSSLPFAPN